MKDLVRFLLIGCLLVLPAARGALAAPGPDAVPEARQTDAADEGAPLTLQVPLFSERFAKTPIALVNDDPIVLEELIESLASMHDGRSEDGTGGRKDFSRALQRLINTRLIVLEAQNMGMDDLEEVKAFLQGRADSTMRMQLQRQVADGVTADEQQVERLYRDLVREYRLWSVMFKTDKEAQALLKAVAGGGDFEALATAAVAGGTARVNSAAELIRAADLLPEVKRAVESMRPGDLSKPIPIKQGTVVVRLDDVRENKSADARDEARRKVLAAAQGTALVEQNRILRKKYLKFNKKLIDSLVLDPKKMETHLKDKRVLARVKGEAPVTVSDLARVIEEKLYHGTGTSTKQKINRRKLDALEEVLAKRVLLAEAKQRGIDRTDAYRKIMREQETSLLFGLFVERVVKPEVKLKHEEVQAYYDEHRNEYLDASRIRLDGLAFISASDAENALASVQRGTDLGWLRGNAPGQAAGDAPGRYVFVDGPVLASELPPSFRAALSGARAGELQVVNDAGGLSYLLMVQEVRVPEPLPLEQVKSTIEQIVYKQKLEAAVDAWAERVRPTYDVRVYLRGAGQGALPDPLSTMVRKSDGLHE